MQNALRQTKKTPPPTKQDVKEKGANIEKYNEKIANNKLFNGKKFLIRASRCVIREINKRV